MLLRHDMPVTVVLNADPQRCVCQIQTSTSLSLNNDPRIDLRLRQTVTEQYPSKPGFLRRLNSRSHEGCDPSCPTNASPTFRPAQDIFQVLGIKELSFECAVPHSQQMLLIHQRGTVHPGSRHGCDLHALNGRHMIFRDQQTMSGHTAPAGPTTFMLYFRDSYSAPHQVFGRRNWQSPEFGGTNADDDMSGFECPHGFLRNIIILTEPERALNLVGHGIQPRAMQKLWVGVSWTCG